MTDFKDEVDEAMHKLESVYEMCAGMADIARDDGFRAIMAMAREYVNAARRMTGQDKDFVMDRIKLTDYEVKYVAEKFDSAFGATFRDPEMRKLFFKHMGWPEKVSVKTLFEGEPNESSDLS